MVWPVAITSPAVGLVAAPRTGKAKENEYQNNDLNQPVCILVQFREVLHSDDKGCDEERRPRQDEHGHRMNIRVDGALVVEGREEPLDVLLPNKSQATGIVRCRVSL